MTLIVPTVVPTVESTVESTVRPTVKQPVVQTFQASLPADLFERLQRARNRYSDALLAASQGDYTCRDELRAVSRYIGRLLAEEARRSPEERGGIRLLNLSLEVARFFPELKGWNQHEIRAQERERLKGFSSIGNPIPVRRSRAS